MLKYSREIKEKILLKLKKNAALAIMNMNLYCDDKGYLYFNEVLFACMKRAYYEDLNENSSNLGIALLKLEEEKNLKKISKMKQKVYFLFGFFFKKFHLFQKKSLFLMKKTIKRGKNQ